MQTFGTFPAPNNMFKNSETFSIHRQVWSTFAPACLAGLAGPAGLAALEGPGPCVGMVFVFSSGFCSVLSCWSGRSRWPAAPVGLVPCVGLVLCFPSALSPDCLAGLAGPVELAAPAGQSPCVSLVFVFSLGPPLAAPCRPV